jgi:hypothetical protein
MASDFTSRRTHNTRMKEVIVQQRPWVVSTAGLDRLQVLESSAGAAKALRAAAQQLIDRLERMPSEKLYV